MQIEKTTSQINNSERKIPSRIMDVAREFESIFANFMVKSMRGTVSGEGIIPKSTGERIYTEMLDTEYSKMISNNSNLGLAEIIARQIIELEGESYNPEDELENLKNNQSFINENVIGISHQEAKPLSYSVERYQKYIEEASKKYDVDSSLISAVIRQESAGNPYAVSRAGAKGLMQLMDSTASDLGVRRVFNAKENIMGGAKYLSMMLKKFNGDEKLALAGYNAGPGAVDKYNGIPPYKETVNYVKRVLNYKNSVYAKQDSSSGQE